MSEHHPECPPLCFFRSAYGLVFDLATASAAHCLATARADLQQADALSVAGELMSETDCELLMFFLNPGFGFDFFVQKAGMTWFYGQWLKLNG